MKWKACNADKECEDKVYAWYKDQLENCPECQDRVQVAFEQKVEECEDANNPTKCKKKANNWRKKQLKKCECRERLTPAYEKALEECEMKDSPKAVRVCKKDAKKKFNADVKAC